MQIHRYRYIDSDEDTFHYRFTALSIKNIYICSQFKFHLATQSSKSSISNDLHIADDFTQISRTSHPRTHTHKHLGRERAKSSSVSKICLRICLLGLGRIQSSVPYQSYLSAYHWVKRKSGAQGWTSKTQLTPRHVSFHFRQQLLCQHTSFRVRNRI